MTVLLCSDIHDFLESGKGRLGLYSLSKTIKEQFRRSTLEETYTRDYNHSTQSLFQIFVRPPISVMMELDARTMPNSSAKKHPTRNRAEEGFYVDHTFGILVS